MIKGYEIKLFSKDLRRNNCYNRNGESITCVGKKRLNLTSIQLLRRSVFDNRFRQATLRQFGLTYKQICSFPNMYTQRQHMYYV